MVEAEPSRRMRMIWNVWRDLSAAKAPKLACRTVPYSQVLNTLKKNDESGSGVTERPAMERDSTFQVPLPLIWGMPVKSTTGIWKWTMLKVIAPAEKAIPRTTMVTVAILAGRSLRPAIGAGGTTRRLNRLR